MIAERFKPYRYEHKAVYIMSVMRLESVTTCLRVLFAIQHSIEVVVRIDVPRPLANDLWVFLFQMIDAEYIKRAGPTGTYVYVKAFIVNVNKCLKTTYQYCK